MGIKASPYNQYWDDKIRGAHNALCAFADTAGKAAAGWPIASQLLINSVMRTKVGAAALTFGAVYANVGCRDWEAPVPSDYEPPSFGGCWKAAPGQCGWGRRFDLDDPSFGASFAPEVSEILDVVYQKPPGFTGPPNSSWVQYRTCGGVVAWSKIANSEEQGRKTGVTIEDAVCDPDEDFNMPRATKPEPFDYTDPETGCSMVVQVEGAYEDASGNIGPVYTIKPAADDSGLRTNSGGRYGGCNFAPVVVYEGDQVYTKTIQGDEYYDWNDDKPWWGPVLDGLIAGTGVWAAQQALDAIFAQRYGPLTYELVAPCNKDPETGEPLTRTWNIPEETYTDRVLSGLTMITEIQQQCLDWKTPVCLSNEGKGDYRTISFISEECSPYGNNRLRKRFRYRSQSGVGLDGVVDHWKDFAFDAGDVCVQHRGSTLGAPQVWAASADEGKRVILHAAAEAGVDPNQTGEWSIGGSDNPRYGVFGRMIVNTKGGYYWISSRLGENGRPLVAKT